MLSVIYPFSLFPANYTYFEISSFLTSLYTIVPLLPMQILAIINFAAAIQDLFLSYLLLNRENTRESCLQALLVSLISAGLPGEVSGFQDIYHIPYGFILGIDCRSWKSGYLISSV